MSFEALDALLIDYTTTQNIAGCVCCIARMKEKEILFFNAYGYAQIEPRHITLNKDTIFDCASLTKPFATALAIMQLYDEERITLSDTVQQYVPGFKETINGQKTIKELLLHTSGLPAWYPLYILRPEQRVPFLANTNSGRHDVAYSCLGYIVLGMIIEAVTNMRLDQYCEKHIYEKIGAHKTFFSPTERSNVAATERGNQHEKQLAARFGATAHVPWREYVLKGEVHDGNAHYCFRGVAGNAGLFSNASDLLRIARQYCAGNIVRPDTVQMMTRDWTGTQSKRGLGWVMDAYPGLFSSRTFSHTGFTGTLFAADPEHDVIIILLTNAAHPVVRPELTAALRSAVAQEVSRQVSA
jgi:CubicO group peptidase (beta-lactamase class C family)